MALSTMVIYEISFSSPLENLVFDELLLDEAEAGRGGDVLRLWESPTPFIVLGRTGKPAHEIYTTRCGRDHVPVLRRCSGGGTVIQGPGCMNFSFILSRVRCPALNDLHRSYQEILNPIIRMLAGLGVSAVFRPISDLALADFDRKFSGNAQRRKREYVLHHGTILYDFDLSLISTYLRQPRDVPAYRKGRRHHDFVANIPVIRIKRGVAPEKQEPGTSNGGEKAYSKRKSGQPG